MYVAHIRRIMNRLEQLLTEVQKACYLGLDYHDRLRELMEFCEKTPIISSLLDQLPEATYDFNLDWRDMYDMWPGGMADYGLRWNAIKQMVEGGEATVGEAWLQVGAKSQSDGLAKVTDMIVVPIHNYIIDQLQSASTMMYALLRYKRWVEWFESDYLRDKYEDDSNEGEAVLDKSIRRFLFESGIDYPFSQPASPRGKADIVAELETDDPLVLEVKVWDSSKGYRENRIRDGLRQIIEYADQFGKESGYLVVFNLDLQPLFFRSSSSRDEWPPRIEYSGKTYYFIDVNIAKKTTPISQIDKGKPVRVHQVDLNSLLSDTLKD